MMKPLVLAYLHQRAAVIVMLLGACLLTAFGNDDPVAFAAIVLGTAVLSWTVVPSGVNAFTCALPIRGGDLVMSRVIGAIAVAVIPVMGWTALEWGSEQTPATILMPGTRLAALAIALAVAAAGVLIHHVVPDALPLPINERVGGRRVADRAAGTDAGTARWGVIRAALPPGYALYCVLLIGAAAVGIATPVYCVLLLVLPGMIRQRTAWLTALPVPDHQRLRLIVLPTVIAFVACIEAGRVLQLSVSGRHGQLSGDWQVLLIHAALLLVLGVMVVILTEVDGILSRSRRGAVALLLRELATLPVAAVVVADIVLRMRGTEGITAITTRMLDGTSESSALHARSLLLLAVTLLVTAYALLEQQLRRSGTSSGSRMSAA
jgi:hypothetical protein